MTDTNLERLRRATDLIVAVADHDAIGVDGRLLLPIREDLKRFKRLTRDGVVIYGRKTLASFPHARPLPGRTNFILSRTLAPDAVSGAEVFAQIDLLQARLLEQVEARPEATSPWIHIIGGREVYATLLDWVGTVECTQICRTFEGADTFMPPGWLDAFDLDWEGPWQRTPGAPPTAYRYRRFTRR